MNAPHEETSESARSDAQSDLTSQPSIEATEDAPPSSFGHENGVLEDVLITEEAENHKANRLLRSTYADKAHRLASYCIQFWVVAVSCNAIIFSLTDKHMLSDTALITITTGVTVNVLAAFLGVIRGLFPSAEINKKKGG